MKAVLLAIGLLLVGMLAWQWHGWPPPALVEGGGSAPAALPPAPGSPVRLPPPTPIEDYASVSHRPLFLPDRRPPPPESEEVEEAPVEEPSDLAGMKLTAVVIAPQVVSAWVQSPASPELLRLRIGDDLEGWSVTGIEPDKLLLERQGTRNELKLRDFSQEPSAAPPAPTQPPVPGAVTRQRAAPPARGGPTPLAGGAPIPGQVSPPPAQAPPGLPVPARARALPPGPAPAAGGRAVSPPARALPPLPNRPPVPPTPQPR